MVVLGLHRHQVPILVQVRLEITLFFHLSLQTEAAVVEIKHPLVAVGRALIANPEWPNLVKAERSGELHAFNVEMLDALV